MSKNTFKWHVDLSLIGEEGKMHYVLIKDFNTFIYDHVLRRGRKNFCCDCLKTIITAEIIKNYVNDCFKISGKQMVKMSNKGEYVTLKNYEREIKSTFMIYAEFDWTLVPEDNDFKLLCVDDRFKKFSKAHSGKEVALRENLLII